MTEPVRFDGAALRALDIAKDVSAQGIDVLLIRDILGRFSLILDDRDRSITQERVDGWRGRASTALGRYAADNPVTLRSKLYMAESIVDSSRVTDEPGHVPKPGQGHIRRLDNTVVGEDWARVTTPVVNLDGFRTARTSMYAYKGGVGRSTATFMLAKQLAERDNCVLAVDLDLESPGLGPMMIKGDQSPRFGLVDQLVESALGNADGLDLVARASQVVTRGNGELWVAPARGSGGDDVPYTYLDKLNRVYASVGKMDFGARLEAAVQACEDAVAGLSRRPDVVLIDSRAGIHDLAAVAISRLCDLALLFGSDNLQTWVGYRDLFLAWRASGQAEAIREKLRMVAAMVPDNKDAYLESFRDNAWSSFSVLYDDISPDDTTGFNPSPEDDNAPHSPIPITFITGLVGLDAASTSGWAEQGLVREAYREFLNTATSLITEEHR